MPVKVFISAPRLPCQSMTICACVVLTKPVGVVYFDCEEAGHPRTRRDGRAVEGSGLENRRSANYRGFESHSLRLNKWTRTWGGAGVDDRGRLLSGCGDNKSPPRVRIPASPPDVPLWLNWIERLVADQKVSGSSPDRGTLHSRSAGAAQASPAGARVAGRLCPCGSIG